MLVLFQRKIIYMGRSEISWSYVSRETHRELGYVPPGARKEEVSDMILPHGLRCEEIKVSSDNGHSLFGVIVSSSGSASNPAENPETLFFYLQGSTFLTHHSQSASAEQFHAVGNAGNPLHRLPAFKNLLGHHSFRTRAGLVAVAPRSYWKSTPCSPSERGILSDYTHALNYAIKRWPNARIIIYGHSLGGSAAVCLTSSLDSEEYSNVQGLILENPIASIPEMVKALYPQRWLPYHYLTPFAFDRWDAVHAASTMSQNSLLWRLSRSMLVLLSEKDELVPSSMAVDIINATKSKGRPSVVIRDALHENAWKQGQWVREIARYVGGISHRL